MTAYFDTSSLAKKYVEEPGSARLDELLENIDQIIVSSVFILEVNAILERRGREKTIDRTSINEIRKQIFKDLEFFVRIPFDDMALENALALIKKYPITTLDSIQLSSGILAKADVFILSDKKLYEYASHELPHTLLI